ARHSISGVKLVCVFSGGGHHTCGAVPERFHLIETRGDFFVGRSKALAFEGVEHLSDKVGPASRLAEHRALSGLYDCSFGAGADKRAHVADEDSARLERRFWHLFEGELAGPIVLYDLFHREAREGRSIVDWVVD